MKQQSIDIFHSICTAIANTITVTTVLGLLPHIATILAILWYLVLFIEKRTNTKMHEWFKVSEDVSKK